MPERSYTSLADRSIRDLVMPEAEHPLNSTPSTIERRHSPRYARRLPGVLLFNGAEHQVKCRDISYSGMCIVASSAIRPVTGTQVEVRIPIGPRVYCDAFSVVQTQTTTEGTAIHLAL